MDDDYRQVFYKQISYIDRVFDEVERCDAAGDTPDSSLLVLENYDEHTALDEILFGM